MNLQGIDVSAFQGAIDWTAVRGDGIRFAMLRAGFGQTADARYESNVRAAGAAGVDIGAYWFSYALSEDDARREAVRLLAAVADRNVTYPLAVDYEDASVEYAKKNGVSVTKTHVTGLLRAFCQTIRAAGYLPMVYTNPSFLRRYVDFAAVGSDARLWLAEWSASMPSYAADIWQYTATGRVAGISTVVDRNICYADFTAAAQKRYQSVSQIPLPLRAEAERLIASGALRGTGEGLDVTDDMLRSMIVAARYTDFRLTEASEPPK